MDAEFPPAVLALFANVHRHPALENDFYRLWMQTRLPPDAVCVFARNYLARTRHTSHMVALTILGIPDLAVRSRIAVNLHSELGCGDPERAHVRLLEAYLVDLLSRLSGQPFTIEGLEAVHPLPSTADFTAQQRALYTSTNPCCVLGAHLAQEWIAYPMLVKLYEGARQYRDLYPSMEAFHEQCEYFHAHIGETEKAHRNEAALAAWRVCGTDQGWQDLAISARRFLAVTADFWRGLASALPVPAVR